MAFLHPFAFPIPVHRLFVQAFPRGVAEDGPARVERQAALPVNGGALGRLKIGRNHGHRVGKMMVIVESLM